MDGKRFTGQAAVVTGSATGIGKACGILRFAEEGADVACMDINDIVNEATCAEIRLLDVDVMAALCNVVDH